MAPCWRECDWDPKASEFVATILLGRVRLGPNFAEKSLDRKMHHKSYFMPQQRRFADGWSWLALKFRP